MDIVQIAKNQQTLSMANRQGNLALNAYEQKRPVIFAQKGYNAETGKMHVVASNGLVGSMNILTSSLPLQRGKAILVGGGTGLF